MPTQDTNTPIIEVALKVKRLLVQDGIDPQKGINCLSYFRSEIRNLSESERADIVSCDTTDAAAAHIMEQYVSLPGVSIDFREFVLAHLNIFIDELTMISSN